MKHLLTIVGPTASGKTDIAIALAKKLNGEIINADSRQVYREVSIGTAAPKGIRENDDAISVDGIRHYGIQCIPINESFSAGAFKKLFDHTLAIILSHKKTPILVGGTGLYIRTALYGLSEIPPISDGIKKQARTLVDTLGTENAFRKLEQIDPKTARIIDPHNPRRIIRALEVFLSTGIPLATWHTQQKKEFLPARIYGIVWDRDILYQRIEKRIDCMFENGLIEEVKQCISQGFTHTAIANIGIGYDAVLMYLDGTCSLDDAKNQMKQKTRNYAKRQMTWFKKDDSITWIHAVETINAENIADKIAIEYQTSHHEFLIEP